MIGKIAGTGSQTHGFCRDSIVYGSSRYQGVMHVSHGLESTKRGQSSCRDCGPLGALFWRVFPAVSAIISASQYFGVGIVNHSVKALQMPPV